jgi:AcrR family transcriptional regulator
MGAAMQTPVPDLEDSHRRRRASALPPGERRDMVVSAALPLVLQHGEAVTTKDIAEAAGIAEGTIFRVFANKEELIEAVVGLALDPAPLEQAIEAIDTARLSLEEAATRAATLIQRRVVDVWQIISGVGSRFHDHEKRPAIHIPALIRMFESYRDELAVQPAEAAHLLRSLVLAMSHPMLSPERAKPSDITKRFLYGVQAGQSC